MSKIADIYHKHHGVTGYRSMQVYLEREGFSYSTATVHKYMNSILRLKSIVRPKKPEYEHGKPHKVFENKIQQDFTADKINQKCLTTTPFLALKFFFNIFDRFMVFCFPFCSSICISAHNNSGC